ncbi:MAG: cytochrome b/b6 domain-containing protein [Gammaproteobacteria bacterium]|nr:cytochrome b/b6 domain-containing protein [Gammaproteobacteria bacterium]
MERIYIFKRFERFWHWSQALLIIFMLISGFEVHGSFTLFGFEDAVAYHTVSAWMIVTLWIFAVFWTFTTGEWKQYIPSMEKVDAMIKYYITGIFTNAPHPFKQTRLSKHNPLQKLAYIFVLAVINPIIWFSGWAYLFYNDLAVVGLGGLPLEWIAYVHAIGAYMMLVFFIAHVYLATAGHTPTSHIKAMITGWEETD